MKPKIFACIASLLIAQNIFCQTHVAEKIPDPATLEIVGYLRADSMKQVSSVRQIVVIDSATKKFALVSIDSFKTQIQNQGLPTVIQAENDTPQTTSATTSQNRVSIILDPGNYVITASCELSNSDYYSGTFANITQGANQLIVGNPYANNIVNWSASIFVTVVAPTTYSLGWFTWGGCTGTIQNARIIAIKTQ